MDRKPKYVRSRIAAVKKEKKPKIQTGEAVPPTFRIDQFGRKQQRAYFELLRQVRKDMSDE